jgi:hypothetical protein
MGNGSGPGRLNSRIYTNSFSTKNYAAYGPFNLRDVGTSFYGLSKPQYSHQTYYQLANNGAGFGSRGDKWLRANGYANQQFIPPSIRFM